MHSESTVFLTMLSHGSPYDSEHPLYIPQCVGHHITQCQPAQLTALAQTQDICI